MPNDIAREIEKLADDLGVDRKRSIGDVAKELNIETHIIRFWEEKFPQIKPEIGAGKRRYYYNKQLKVIKRIKKFLYEDGYTINGLQKLLKKRKADAYKEEDLDIIAQTFDASLNHKQMVANSSQSNTTCNITPLTLDKKSKSEAELLITRAHQNLSKLKTLLHKSIL
jgi:DNA-binding transcriptional MerR regulator